MSDRLEHAIDILSKARNDKRTLIIVSGCIVSFGVAIGAIAVYERLIKELHAGDERSYFSNDEPRW